MKDLTHEEVLAVNEIVKARIEKEVLPHQPEHSVKSIMSALDQDYVGFDIQLPFEKYFEQELPYLIKHGMTSFNCGYAGKK